MASTKLVRELLSRVKDCTSLDAAKAYVDAALSVMDEDGRVAVVITAVSKDHFIDVIKTVRNETQMGLKEAKDAVESLPQHFQNLTIETASKFVKALRTAGAEANIV